MATSRVLYVEDDTFIRGRITGLLSQELGMDVVGFGVLEEAKAAYARGGFDAVILDGNIQKHEDGWAWATELQGQGAKVLVLSISRLPNAPVGLAYISKGRSLEDIKALLTGFLNS